MTRYRNVSICIFESSLTPSSSKAALRYNSRFGRTFGAWALRRWRSSSLMESMSSATGSRLEAQLIQDGRVMQQSALAAFVLADQRVHDVEHHAVAQ